MANDYPFYDVVKEADAHVVSGATVMQKFTCEACGARQTIDVPNTFYKLGSCEECHHVTNLEECGCNYILFLGGAPISDAERLLEQKRSHREYDRREKKNG